MKTNTLIIILCILLIIILASIPSGPGWLTNATAPIREGTTTIVSQAFGFWDWVGDVRHLAQERDEYAKERNQLLAKVADLEAVERQNQALREQLSLSKDLDQELMLAESYGLVERGSAKYLLISKGRNDGVKENQVVLTNQVLVGRVEEAMSDTSLVQLPQTSDSVIPVIIRHGESVSKGVVTANFNLTAQLEQVLQTEQLQAGSTITTSGEGGTYPPNLVVGKVGQIESSDQDVFQTAKVEILWDISGLETVFVVL